MLKQRHTPPYSQQFRYVVPSVYHDWTLIALYNDRFNFRSETHWMDVISKGDISVNGQGVDPDFILKVDDVIITKRHDVTEPDVDAGYEILYEQDGVLIVNKPAPLPVHPAGRYYKNSLIYILREQNPEVTYHTIHRLDNWTTGVLVLATEKNKARELHQQVDQQQMKKSYGILAYGDFGCDEFIIDEAIGRKDGTQRGTGLDVTDSKEAVTRFRPVAKKGDVTLLEAEPITGRTNQIRVHVQTAGGYVMNDPRYSPDGQADIPFLGLHCRQMGLVLAPEQQMTYFKASWPEHFRKYFDDSELF